MNRRLSGPLPGWVVPALIVVTSAVFFRSFFAADVLPGFNDLLRLHYPWRWFDQAGHHASWLPYATSGEPLFANVQLWRWYPVARLLEAALPLSLAFGVSIALHITICALSSYWLLKRETGSQSAAALGAMSFAFGGYLVAQMYAGHMTVITAVAWLPIVFGIGKRAITDRRFDLATLAAGAFGLQVLAGHPPTAFFTAALLTSWAVFTAVRHTLTRQWLTAAAVLAVPAVILGLGAGLAGIVVVPASEFSAFSTRGAGVTFAFATIYQLPWSSLSGLLFPNLFGSPLDDSYVIFGPYWEFALYFGTLPLACAVVALRRPWKPLSSYLLVIAVGATLLALGSLTPAFRLAWEFVPGLSSFRVPARFLLLTMFAMTGLAAIGFAGIQGQLDVLGRRTIARLGSLCLVMGPIALLAGVVVRAMSTEVLAWARPAIERGLGSQAAPSVLEHYQSRLPRLLETASIDVVITGAMIVGVGALFVWRARTETAPRYFTAGAIALLALDLGIHQPPFLRTTPVADLHQTPEIMSAVLASPGRFRVWDPDHTLFYNQQILWKVETLEGYNPLRLDHINQALVTLRRSPLEESKGVLAVLGARWVIAKSAPDVRWIERIGRFGAVDLYENKAALPKAFLVNPAELRLDVSDVSARVHIGGTASSDGVQLIRLEPDAIEVSAVVSGATPRALVLSELTYPGWNVTVDGVTVEARDAYGLLRAVILEPGPHRVVWRFEPRSERVGRAVTLSATAVWLILICLCSVRQRWFRKHSLTASGTTRE